MEKILKKLIEQKKKISDHVYVIIFIVEKNRLK